MAPTEATAADAVVATLRANGVDTVFGLPGEENLPVVSALRRAGMQLVVCRHEQHAGFMAVAHARLTGQLAVCLATLGPGALNLFTPLAQGLLMGVPLLAITGQKALTDNEEGSFQMVDVVGAARPIVSAALSLSDPHRAGPVTADAVRRATTAPRGPVVLELPEDVAATTVGSPAPPCPVEIAPPVADDATIARLVERIRRAERPLLLAGAHAATDPLQAPIQRLVERTGLSVLATQMGKGALSEEHPRSLRSLGIHRTDHANEALDRCDLVVTLGYQPLEHPPLAWQPDGGRPIVHLGESPAAREAGYEPELDVVGHLVDTVSRLADTDLAVAQDWSSETRRHVVEALAAETPPTEALDPLTVVRTVADRSRPGDVVALDNGVYKIWFARHYPATGPHALVLDNATASMGAGLATANAAARLGHDALAVVGDGGLLMNVGDLETVVRLGLDLTVLVLRDDAYGFIAWHQDEQDRARHGVALGNPDLSALAQAFGGRGVEVNAADELGTALDEGRATAGLTLIDCPIEYTVNALLPPPD